MELTWEALTWEAIAGFGTAFILLGAAVFAWLQLRAMRLARSAQIEVQLVRDLTNKRAKMKFSSIYEMTRSEVDQLEAGSERACEIEEILDRFEMLSVFVDKGIIDKDIAIMEWQDPAIRCWWRLYYTYIERQRDDRGGRYAQHLQDFVARCLKYQVKNVPEDRWTKYKRQNLVEALLQWDMFKDIRLLAEKKQKI